MRQGQQVVEGVARIGRAKARDGNRVLDDDGSATPDFGEAEIDTRKITAYVMNPDHPVGRNKYRVINSATGLHAGDAERIEQQIRDGVDRAEPIMGLADQYGQRWAVDVPLSGPEGTLVVRTAWIIDVGSTVPRLVTISFP